MLCPIKSFNSFNFNTISPGAFDLFTHYRLRLGRTEVA